MKRNTLSNSTLNPSFPQVHLHSNQHELVSPEEWNAIIAKSHQVKTKQDWLLEVFELNFNYVDTTESKAHPKVAKKSSGH